MRAFLFRQHRDENIEAAKKVVDKSMKLIRVSDVFGRSLAAWIAVGIITVLINGFFVGRDFANEGRSSALKFIVLAGPSIIFLQIVLSALLIRNYRFKSKIWSVITGGITGLLMPVNLFLLIWAFFTLNQPSWGQYFANGVVWTMIACSPSLLGVGLVSGIFLGYTGRKSKT